MNWIILMMHRRPTTFVAVWMVAVLVPVWVFA